MYKNGDILAVIHNVIHNMLTTNACSVDGGNETGAKRMIDHTEHERWMREAIAEARETAVIYGMPRAAIETGVIDVITPLDGIAAAIVQSIGE